MDLDTLTTTMPRTGQAAARIAAVRGCRPWKGLGMSEKLQRHEVWFDRDGKPHAIAGLEEAHLVAAYRYIIRSICRKAGELEGCGYALEDERINAQEHDAAARIIKQDLLGFERDLNNLRREVERRGLQVD